MSLRVTDIRWISVTPTLILLRGLVLSQNDCVIHQSPRKYTRYTLPSLRSVKVPPSAYLAGTAVPRPCSPPSGSSLCSLPVALHFIPCFFGWDRGLSTPTLRALWRLLPPLLHASFVFLRGSLKECRPCHCSIRSPIPNKVRQETKTLPFLLPYERC